MPTYEYVCRACGERLEVVQSFADDALTTCPACEGELRKVFSAAGIIFKGSGWHVKDYAAKGSNGTSSRSSGDDASSSSSDASGDGSSSTSKKQQQTPATTGSKGDGSSAAGGSGASTSTGSSSSSSD